MTNSSGIATLSSRVNVTNISVRFLLDEGKNVLMFGNCDKRKINVKSRQFLFSWSSFCFCKPAEV